MSRFRTGDRVIVSAQPKAVGFNGVVFAGDRGVVVACSIDSTKVRIGESDFWIWNSDLEFAPLEDTPKETNKETNNMETNKIEVKIPDGWNVSSTDVVDGKVSVVLEKKQELVIGEWYRSTRNGWWGKLKSPQGDGARLDSISGFQFYAPQNILEKIEPFEEKWIALNEGDRWRRGDEVWGQFTGWHESHLPMSGNPQRRKVKVLKEEFMNGNK